MGPLPILSVLFTSHVGVSIGPGGSIKYENSGGTKIELEIDSKIGVQAKWDYNTSGNAAQKQSKLKKNYNAFSDTLSIINDGTEDMVLCEHDTDHELFEPGSFVILAPGQSILITEISQYEGTVKNTSVDDIIIGPNLWAPAGEEYDYEIAI